MVREWKGMLLETFSLLSCLSILQSHPKLHGPEQAGLSKESKDSQRTKWLEMRFFSLSWNLVWLHGNREHDFW